MNHTPRHRTVSACTLLSWSPSGAGVTACGSDSHPLAAQPYDASGTGRLQRARRRRREGRPGQAPGGHRQGHRRPDNRRHGHRRRGPPPRGRTHRRRRPLALHGPAGRRRQVHRQGHHGGRGRRPGHPDAHLRDRAPAKKLLDGRLRPRGGHVRRRPARHRRAQPPGQGQGGQRRRRARPEGRLPARRGGRLALGGRQDPALPPEGVLARPAPPSAPQQPPGRQGRATALRRPLEAAEAHHRRPDRGHHRRRLAPDDGQRATAK